MPICQILKSKLFRNKLNRLIEISKMLYHEDYFRYNKSNIKNIWKCMKQIVAFKPEAYVTPSKIVVSSNKVLTNTRDITNEFLNHTSPLLNRKLLTIIIAAMTSYFLLLGLP